MNAHSLVLAAVSPHLADLLSADSADPEGDDTVFNDVITVMAILMALISMQ